jgi:hypothetical protein
MPRDSTFANGWSALCFADDASCDQWMTRVVQAAPRAHRWTFPVRLSLWGVKGATRDVAAIMVGPSITPDEEIPAEKRLDEVGARSR